MITCKYQFKVNHSYYSADFMSYSNQIGGWSTEGLTVDKSHSSKTLVTCLTRHLTSFAVLVSIQDERPVRSKIRIVL